MGRRPSSRAWASWPRSARVPLPNRGRGLAPQGLQLARGQGLPAHPVERQEPGEGPQAVMAKRREHVGPAGLPGVLPTGASAVEDEKLTAAHEAQGVHRAGPVHEKRTPAPLAFGRPVEHDVPRGRVAAGFQVPHGPRPTPRRWPGPPPARSSWRSLRDRPSCGSSGRIPGAGPAVSRTSTWACARSRLGSQWLEFRLVVYSSAHRRLLGGRKDTARRCQASKSRSSVARRAA